MGDAAIRGVYLAEHASLVGFTISNCATRITTVNNSNANGQGGGVRGVSASSSILSNCVVAGNSAIVGGGVHTCLLFNSQVNNNTATGGSGNYRGGGGGYNCNMVGCVVRNNRGDGQGGGVYSGSYVRDSIFEGNRSSGNGGNATRAVTTISNCLIRANYNGYSGAISGGTVYDCVML